MCHSHTEVHLSGLESLNKDTVLGLQGTKASESVAQACPPPPKQGNLARPVLMGLLRENVLERDQMWKNTEPSVCWVSAGVPGIMSCVCLICQTVSFA